MEFRKPENRNLDPGKSESGNLECGFHIPTSLFLNSCLPFSKFLPPVFRIPASQFSEFLPPSFWLSTSKLLNSCIPVSKFLPPRFRIPASQFPNSCPVSEFLPPNIPVPVSQFPHFCLPFFSEFLLSHFRLLASQFPNSCFLISFPGFVFPPNWIHLQIKQTEDCWDLDSQLSSLLNRTRVKLVFTLIPPFLSELLQATAANYLSTHTRKNNALPGRRAGVRSGIQHVSVEEVWRKREKERNDWTISQGMRLKLQNIDCIIILSDRQR